MSTVALSQALSWKQKYGDRVQSFRYDERRWPDVVLQKCPILFSTDLRDGNQALRNPMTFDQKLRLYRLLVSMGFKEIEVGHPYANQVEFDFIRHLVESPGLIPDDVLIQVIAPCSEEAVERAVQSVHGAAKAVIFTYLPSSDNYRETVLGISEEAWVDHAARVARFARSITTTSKYSASTKWTFNFGFEDFANARLEAVVRCAEAVKASWCPSADERMIFALASSVESSMPNIFADQVERFCHSVSDRSCWLVSVHTHNDRGGAISTAELASLAGADRVEGCLFGNGERAGNMDLVTYGLNRVSEGLDCGLDLSKLRDARQIYEDIVGIPIHPRTPYSGAYCLTAFSGGHQDAIIKGLERRTLAVEDATQSSTCWPKWSVPYLPIDPVDIGFGQEDVIEINSQSGKSGVKWVLQSRLGHEISREDAEETVRVVKMRSAGTGKATDADELCGIYRQVTFNHSACKMFCDRLSEISQSLQLVSAARPQSDSPRAGGPYPSPQAVLAACSDKLHNRDHLREEQTVLHVLDLCNADVEVGGLGFRDRRWRDFSPEDLSRILELTESWWLTIKSPNTGIPKSTLPQKPVGRQPMTLTSKILAHHAISCAQTSHVITGEVLRVNIDWVIASELSWVGMKRSVAGSGVSLKAWRNDRFWLAGDHAVDPRIYAEHHVRDLINGLEDARKELRMTENQGSNYTILHTEFTRERAEPGMLILGSDSHTCSAGAASALAIGLGAADVMAALMTGQTWLRVPESIRVDFIGRPLWHIGGKDIILHILGRLKRNTLAADRVVEFGGPGAAMLSCDARFAICNMCTELGAITGIFEPDTVVEAFLKGRRKGMYKSNALYFAADSDAPYHGHVTVDLSQVEPYIALYPNPDDVQPISMHLGLKFDGIFIGACTTTEEDLVLAGLILRAGLARGYRLAAGRRIVVPGSLPIVRNLRELGLLDVFAQCGYEQPAPSCSLCLGIGADVAPSGTKWLSTQNRNFENRMGKGAIGYLCSAAVAAASTFSMAVTDPSELLQDVSPDEYRACLMRVSSAKRKPDAFTKVLQYCEPRLDGAIQSPSTQGNMNSSVKPAFPVIRSRMYRLGDFVDTDAIIPAKACLGDPSDDMLGDRCLEISKPDFRESVRNDLAVVVAGTAFGCGSSREEAARALKGLGVKCVIAKSFSYIFSRNMPNIGMLAISIDAEDFFTAAAHGQQIIIDVERCVVEVGHKSWGFALGDIERELVRAGGLGVALWGHGEEASSTLRTSRVMKDGGEKELDSNACFACSLDDLSW